MNAEAVLEEVCIVDTKWKLNKFLLMAPQDGSDGRKLEGSTKAS